MAVCEGESSNLFGEQAQHLFGAGKRRLGDVKTPRFANSS